MFSAEDLQARLREKPFCPLRINVSEGQHFDIHLPDLVMVGRHDLSIGFPAPDNLSIYDRIIRVPLVNVVSLEDLPTTPTASGGKHS